MRSPFCYLNALEAKHYFDIPPERSIMIIFYENLNDIDMKHFKKIINKKHWKKIFYVPKNVSSSKEKNEIKNKFLRKIISFRPLQKIINILYYIRKLNTVISSINNAIDKIFLQSLYEYSSLHFVNTLKPKKIYNMDEGARILHISQVRRESNEKKYKFFEKEYFKKLACNYLFGYHVKDIREITYFTAYNLIVNKGDSIIQNKYIKIGEKISNNPRMPKTAFFFGTPAVEGRSMSKDIYFMYIEKAKTYLADYDFIYIPHRGESVKNINRLKNKLGIKIFNFSMPYEFRIYTGGPIPEVIASFSSSVLQNCYAIFGDEIKIISFYTKSKHVNKWAEKVYDYFKANSNTNFKVVDFISVKLSR